MSLDFINAENPKFYVLDWHDKKVAAVEIDSVEVKWFSDGMKVLCEGNGRKYEFYPESNTALCTNKRESRTYYLSQKDCITSEFEQAEKRIAILSKMV